MKLLRPALSKASVLGRTSSAGHSKSNIHRWTWVGALAGAIFSFGLNLPAQWLAHGLAEASKGQIQLQEAQGIELLHQHHLPARAKRRQKAGHGGVGIKRGGQDRDRFRPIGRKAALNMLPAHFVAMNNALGQACSAAGIDDVKACFGRDVDGMRRCAYGGHPLA